MIYKLRADLNIMKYNDDIDLNIPQNKQKKQQLINNLYDFLRQNKYNLQLEVKPKTEFELLNQQKNNFNKVNIPIEIVKKENSNKFNNQINLIANNIAIKLFELNNEKFLAVLNRMNLWGYEITLEQFILRYYIVIKNDNRLRQFIILYLSKIIRAVKNIIELQLINRMHQFNFVNKFDKELENLEYDLAKKVTELLKVNPKDQEDILDNPPEFFKDENEVLSFKEQILADLKAKNPELEDQLRDA